MRWLAQPKQLELSIAKVKKLSGDIRRRYSRDSLWLPLKKDDLIHDRDVIFSGPNSHAELEFPNATSLTIQANALVQVQQTGARKFVKLESGDAEARSESSDQIDLIRSDDHRSINIKDKATALSSLDNRREMETLLSRRNNLSGGIIAPRPDKPVKLANSQSDDNSGSFIESEDSKSEDAQSGGTRADSTLEEFESSNSRNYILVLIIYGGFLLALFADAGTELLNRKEARRSELTHKIKRAGMGLIIPAPEMVRRISRNTSRACNGLENSRSIS